MNAHAHSFLKTTGMPSSFTPTRGGLMQRKSACGGSSELSGECEECKTRRLTMQRKARGHQAENSSVPPVVHEVLRSPGQPLDAATRAFMEQRLGHNFSQVRVHTDARATESAQAVNAAAYTVGHDVVFTAGRYAPQSSEGRRLLAHELTHVIQQGGLSTVSPRLNTNTARHAAAEKEAEASSLVLDGGRKSAAINQRVTPQMQRLPDDRQKTAQGGVPLEKTFFGPEMQSGEFNTCIKGKGEENANYCYRLIYGKEAPLPAKFPTSTPLDKSATFNFLGVATFDVNGVQVIVKPDLHSDDPKMKGRAETGGHIVYGGIHYPAPKAGKITSFSGPGQPKLIIQTVYGPGATAEGPSGYGRGTAPEDIKAGKTTLGYHEGSHGTDFIQYLRDNPFPQFAGKVGMMKADFDKASSDYFAAIVSHNEKMQRLNVLKEHCVGITIDQYNKEHGIVAPTICTP